MVLFQIVRSDLEKNITLSVLATLRFKKSYWGGSKQFKKKGKKS